MSSHEAAFAKLGYLYQIRYALYRAIEDTGAYYIKLEALDDVEVGDSSSTQLFQLKHHVGDLKLTNKSVDFWKSIGIWAEQILDSNIQTEEFKYYLITTSSIPKNSISSFLGSKGRNINLAVDIMDENAKGIKNKAIEKSIYNYMKLSATQKKSMCNSIIVMGRENDTSDIVKKIKSRLEYTVQEDFIDSLYEKLEGWWFNNVVNFLLGKKEKIWREEVRDKVLQLSYDYHPNTLPIDFEDVSIDEEEKNGFLDYQFVTQLKLIGVGTERIHNAIVDYYKAYNQRTKWIKDDLSIEYDISNYEKRLKDDWSRFRLAVVDELEDAEDNEIKKAGRSIFNWVETQADIRIREKVSQRFIMTGSYHILTNRHLPEVGWHPHFKEKLKSIIGSEG